MARPRAFTLAARLYQLLVTVGAVVLAWTAFLPWCRIYGPATSFFDAGGVRGLAVVELVVAGLAVLVAWIAPSRVKRTGVVVGMAALICNVVGMVAAARMAEGHSSGPYPQLQSAFTVRPLWGAWLAVVTCVVLVIGGMSNWRPTKTRPPQAPPPHYHETWSTDPVSHVHLPHMDDVLGPPRHFDW